MSNGLEYLLGLDPVTPESHAPGLPSLTVIGANEIFSFSMPNPMGPDARYLIQSSTDLAIWSDLAARSGNGPWTGALPVVVTPQPGGRELITLTRPGGAVRRFYRLNGRVEP